MNSVYTAETITLSIKIVVLPKILIGLNLMSVTSYIIMVHYLNLEFIIKIVLKLINWSKILVSKASNIKLEAKITLTIYLLVLWVILLKLTSQKEFKISRKFMEETNYFSIKSPNLFWETKIQITYNFLKILKMILYFLKKVKVERTTRVVM